MTFSDFVFLAQFQLFGLGHLLAILATTVTAAVLTRYARQSNNQENLTKIRYTLATLLVAAVALDPVLTLVRYGTGSSGWEIVLNSSLPFYLCDIVSILLAYGLITGNQRVCEIGFLWGLAGTIQGLITPALPYDGTTLEFYVFFIQHGGVPVAAVLLVWGLHIVPEKGAFKRIVCWSWIYMAATIVLNWIIGQNYGFLNGLPDFASPLDHLGPYPFYLISLQGIFFTLFYILLKIAPKTSCHTASEEIEKETPA